MFLQWDRDEDSLVHHRKDEECSKTPPTGCRPAGGARNVTKLTLDGKFAR